MAFIADFTALGIDQNPYPPSSRLGAEPRIVLTETFFLCP